MENTIANLANTEGKPVVASSKEIDTRVLEIILRISCVMCFIGHGTWGLITKQGWVPFFELFWISESAAYKLMPIVGSMDIFLGLSIIFFPTRAALLFMFFWAVFTALLRPMTDMGWWEFFERAGNYGPPLVYFLLAGPSYGWVNRIKKISLSRFNLPQMIWIFKFSIAFLLIGHGGFGAFQQKSMLFDHWISIGVDVTPSTIVMIGWLEIIAGVTVLILDSPLFLLFVMAWKIGTELLYPVSAGSIYIFEWIERGGSYMAPLALIFLISVSRNMEQKKIGRANYSLPTLP